MRTYMHVRGRWASVDDRFWSKVKMTDTCWVWLAGTNGVGYGMFRNDKVHYLAHRFAYEHLVGLIPEGLVVDHLCRNPACVRPEHLEVVTQRVNTLRGLSPAARQARQTHCWRGHPLGPYVPGKKRRCATCHRERMRAKYRLMRGLL